MSFNNNYFLKIDYILIFAYQKSYLFLLSGANTEQLDLQEIPACRGSVVPSSRYCIRDISSSIVYMQSPCLSVKYNHSYWDSRVVYTSSSTVVTRDNEHAAMAAGHAPLLQRYFL